MAQNVRLHPLIRERLGELQKELELDAGLTATQEEIVAALVQWTTLPQLVGMLPAFKKQAARVDDEVRSRIGP
jgi:hypothetical protein